MPIKGLTDGESFPQIGKLKKGAEKSGNAPGKDLDFFRFDSKDQKAIADFTAVYGDRPQEINCFLPYATVDEVFFTCKEHWIGGGLVHRCDGEIVSVLQIAGGRYQTKFAAPVPCPGECKETGRLKLIIPELRRFAYVSAETHSLNDIRNLYQQLRAIETTFGRLNGIPFVLRRCPEKISTPRSDGKRVRSEKWMLSIEISPEWAELQLEATRTMALSQARVAGALPSAPVYALPEVTEEPQVQQRRIDYRQSDTWIKFQGAMQQAKSHDRINQLVKAAYERIEGGVLPDYARIGIESEVEKAFQRLQDASIPISVTAITPPDDVIDIEPEDEDLEGWDS